MVNQVFVKAAFLLIVCSSLFVANSYAGEASLSPATYQALNRVHSLLEKKKYIEAEKKLLLLVDKRKRDAYEKAFVLRSLGYLYAETDRFNEAIGSFKKALKLDALPEGAKENVVVNLGELYLSQENYHEAITLLRPWLEKAENPPPTAYAVLGAAYAHIKQHEQALVQLKKAILHAKKPREEWYGILLAVYYELDKLTECASLLEQMIRRFPDEKRYWMQLSSIYLELKEDKRALAVMITAQQLGLLNQSEEFVRLAKLLIYLNVPYRAGEMLTKWLESGIIESTEKNWQLLSTAWLESKEENLAEKALSQAATLSKVGNIYLQLAQLRAEKENWQDAAGAARHALERGALTEKGKAYLVLGLSLYELKEFLQARQALLKAATFARTKKNARQWLEYMKAQGEVSVTSQ